MNLPPLALVIEATRDLIAPAFGTAVVVLALGVRLIGRHAAPWLAVVAWVGAFLACNSLAQINPDWLPTNNKRLHWLLVVAVGGALAGLPYTYRKPELGTVLVAIVVAFTVVRILPREYQTEPLWVLPAFLFLAVGGGFALHDLADVASHTAAAIAGLSLLTAGAVVIHAHSKSLLDVATIGGMVLLGLGLVALFANIDLRPVMPVAGLLLSATLMAGYHETYSNVPWVGFLLPTLAPFGGLVGLLPAVRRRGRISRFLIPVAVALIPLVAAVAVATANETLEFEVG